MVPKALQSANVSPSPILRRQKEKHTQKTFNQITIPIDRFSIAKSICTKKTLENLLMDIIGKTLKVQNTQEKTFLKHTTPKQEQNQFQPQNNK